MCHHCCTSTTSSTQLLCDCSSHCLSCSSACPCCGGSRRQDSQGLGARYRAGTLALGRLGGSGGCPRCRSGCRGAGSSEGGMLRSCW
jgi:hypothetical protein